LHANNGLELVASVLISCWGRGRVQQLATSQDIGGTVKRPLQQFLDRIRIP
jgi:hypothetical protein